MTEESTPARPKAKKLPFKPTALRKSALQRPVTPSDDTNADDGLDLFRRSKEMEPIVAADRERRMKKKKQKQEEEQRKTAESAKRSLDRDDAELKAKVAPEQYESPGTATRGTPVGYSSKDGDGMASELVTPPASKRTCLDLTSSRYTNIDVENTDLSPGYSPSARLLRSPTKSTTSGNLRQVPIVLIESDDDDSILDAQVAPTTKQREGSVEVVETNPMAAEDDDEFSEYVHRAEEQLARGQAMLNVGADGSATKHPVEIIVTSVIPGTRACHFKFLFDKKLRVARNTWLQLQQNIGILRDVQKEDDIVLTWQRQKVYTFSTLLTLGIRPQGNGRVVVDGNSSKGLTEDRTRVLMEAWTLDLFHEMKREEERRRKREAGELSDEDDLAVEESPAPEVKIRVILKARDLEDVNLTVRPETTVETLIIGYRTQRKIGSDKDVGLWFDGDRLEEHVTMEEAEIDDLDTFEVHIR